MQRTQRPLHGALGKGELAGKFAHPDRLLPPHLLEDPESIDHALHPLDASRAPAYGTSPYGIPLCGTVCCGAAQHDRAVRAARIRDAAKGGAAVLGRLLGRTIPETSVGRRASTKRPGAAPAWALAVALAAGLTGCGGSTAGGGSGDAWEPERPVTIVVPFAPGGGSDVFGRALAKGIEEARPDIDVKVENRPGGSGAIGYSFLLSKQADPHYLIPSETAGVALPVTTDTPWTWSDFTPVMQIAEDVTLMVVPKDSPYQELQDVVGALKKGGQVRVGLAGATGLDAIVTGLMEQDQGVKYRRVTFDSGGEIVNALIGGDIDTAMLNPSEVIGQIKAGEVRPVAVFADSRYEDAPLDEVPTAEEQGVNVSFTQYRGVFAAGDITDAESAYWEETVRKWTQSPSYSKYLDDNFLRPVKRPHDEFVTYLKAYEKQLQGVLG
ncbi:MAG: tripartite tricarboxylate transporter substrate binding protein [Streptosporangiales bacterium]|nr:tripartite tricarboxylate transporter substrate binding protein [Streptosporangiales bacterium]